VILGGGRKEVMRKIESKGAIHHLEKRAREGERSDVGRVAQNPHGVKFAGHSLYPRQVGERRHRTRAKVWTEKRRNSNSHGAIMIWVAETDGTKEGIGLSNNKG